MTVLVEPKDYPFVHPPFQHQIDELYTHWKKVNRGIFWEMGCVDSETEYLSPEGWVRISEYDGGKVGQYHLDGRADFVEPIAYVKEPCSEFYHFKHSRGLDQVLSLEHRVLAIVPETRLRSKSVGPCHVPGHHWVEISASEAAHIGREYPNFRIETTFHLDDDAAGIGLSEVDLRLMVAYSADGTKDYFRKTDQVQLAVIRVKKERKKDRLRLLLTESGRDFKEYVCEDGYSSFRFVPPLPDKGLSRWWGKTSYRDKQIIVEEAEHWDGTSTKAGGYSFGSTIKQEIDFIQYCSVSTGRRASIDQFRVHMVGKGRSGNQVQLHCRPETVSSDGFKYCFKVPSSYLIFRRNGCVFVTGNCGKSKVVCDNAGLMFLNGIVDGMVCVAKKGEYLNWSRVELPEHMPEQVPWKAFEFNTLKWRTPTGQQEFKAFLAFKGLKVVVANIESFAYSGVDDCLKAFFKALKKKIFWVTDEATCVKNPKAKRSSVLYGWAQKSVMRRTLTGLPNPQSPLDFWGISLSLKKGLLGTTSLTAFKNTYAIMEEVRFGEATFKQIVAWQRLDELNETVKTWATIVKKSECLDLPDKIYKKQVVELTPEQKEAIKELRKKHQIEIECEEITATTAMSLMNKVHQIICGQVKTDSGEYLSIPNNRIQTLTDILEDHQGKAIIWANYRQNLKDVQESLTAIYGPSVVEGYYGGIDMDSRPGIIKRFQDRDSELRFLVANPQSAGYGLTLVSANLAIYYSNGYNLEHRLQSEDRIHRIGQKEHPVYIDLYVPETIDEAIMTALRNKRELSDAVLEGKFRIRDWI